MSVGTWPSGCEQYDSRENECRKNSLARNEKGEAGDSRRRASRTKRARDGHSSPVGAVSVGPSALDRRTSTIHSSVRSHHSVRWLRGAPRRRLRGQCSGLPRCGRQLGASGRCEKVPNVAIEPGRALGAVPWAEPARRAHAQLLFDTALADARLSTLRGPNRPCCAFPPTQPRRRLAP